MIREGTGATTVIDETMPIGIGAAGLLAAVTLALLPNGYEADVIKQPLLVCGAGVLVGMYVTIVLLRRRRAFVRTPVNVLLLLLLLLTALQTLRAPDIRSARDAAFLWGAFGVLFVAGFNAFGSTRALRILERSLVMVVAAVEVVGVVQFLFPELPGVDFDFGAENRVTSTLGSASIHAAFLAAMLPVLLAEARRHSGPARTGLSVLIPGAFFLILASGSRGGLIAALVATGFFLFLSTGSRKRALVVFGAMICALAIVIVAVPSFQNRFFGLLAGTGTASLDRRVVIWEAAWNAVRAAPFAGHGSGSFESIVPLFRDPEYWLSGSEDIVRHAHNEILELWAELGIAGAVLWCGIVVLTLRRGIAMARIRADDHRRDLIAACTAALAGILAENLAGVSLRNPAVGGYASLFAGIIWGNRAAEKRVALQKIGANVPRAAALLPVVLAAAWAIVTMDQQIPMFRSESHYINARVLESRMGPGAEEEYLSAYEACPWNPRAAMSAAGVYFRTGQPEKSLEALDAVQRRFPSYPRSNLLRGMVLASRGQQREADIFIKKEIAIRSGPEALHIQSIVARALGDAAGEREALRRLVTASISSGRDFFVVESCARLRQLPGPDSTEVTALVESALQKFGGEPRTEHQKR
jgi:O-antigen ligase